MILTHHGIDSLRRGPQPYMGPFVLLNNYESMDNNICPSDIGPNMSTPSSNFSIVDSNVYSGKKCLLMTTPSSAGFVDTITLGDTFTCEAYVSNFSYINSTQVAKIRFGDFFFQLDGWRSRYRIQTVSGNYTLYNGASFLTSVAGWDYFIAGPSLGTPCHFAVVVDGTDAYIFLNGTLFVKITKPDSFSKTFYPIFYTENLTSIMVGINFICARNGDFSNNLQSFDVPTSKYHL